MTAGTEPATFPVVLQASQVQFAPSGRLTFPRVESRMVFLCRGGTGAVRINDQTYRLVEGMVLVLPWGHTISYAADDMDPFLVGGAHLVARHDAGAPIRPTIAHGPDHELAGCAWRRDDPSLGGHQVIATTAADHPDLFDVTAYAIAVFARAEPAGRLMRALGTLLADELDTLDRRHRSPYAANLPADLRRLLSYIDRQLEEPLTARVLAQVAGVSEATLTRRFRAHLDSSPMAWVIGRRIAHATNLLRTTSLPVAQVARRCGIGDPYYFSRLFRERLGESPSAWRRSHHVL